MTMIIVDCQRASDLWRVTGVLQLARYIASRFWQRTRSSPNSAPSGAQRWTEKPKIRSAISLIELQLHPQRFAVEGWSLCGESTTVDNVKRLRNL